MLRVLGLGFRGLNWGSGNGFRKGLMQAVGGSGVFVGLGFRVSRCRGFGFRVFQVDRL